MYTLYDYYDWMYNWSYDPDPPNATAFLAAHPWGYGWFTPISISPKVPHIRLIGWFTSGFE